MITSANRSNYSLNNWWLLNENFLISFPIHKIYKPPARWLFFDKIFQRIIRGVGGVTSDRHLTGSLTSCDSTLPKIRLYTKFTSHQQGGFFLTKLRFVCSILYHLELVSGAQQFVRFVKQAQHNIRRKKISQFTLFAQYNIYYLYQKGNDSSWQFSCTNLLYIRVVILCVYEYK